MPKLARITTSCKNTANFYKYFSKKACTKRDTGYCSKSSILIHWYSEKEREFYEKWHTLVLERICEVYPGKFDEKEVDKLAYENARYMISVFCPTAMVYSLPFRNIFYVLDWTEQMKKNLEKLSGGFIK